MKRLVLPLAMALGLGLAPAAAQTYPARPISMIVPFAAGGPTDVIARIVSEHMSRTLGQQIVVENVAGAGGTTGTLRASQAAPDGYTVMMGQMGTHAAAVGLYPSLRYDPQTSFQPIGVAGATPILIVAKKGFAPKTLAEFITHMKTQGEKVNEAHAGVGSTSFTTCVLLSSQIGAKPNRVAYRGTGPALNDLVAGQVDFMCDQIVNLTEQVKSGNIKAYAIATPERSPALPDVPTTIEAGLPQYQISGWNAVFAPKGIPADVTGKLVDALDKALEDETVKKRLMDLGTVLPSKVDRAPAGLAAIVKRDVELLTPILKASGAVGQ